MKIKLFVFSSIFITNIASANTLNIDTIESNFNQSVTNEQNAKVVYSGKMYASKSKNQALWEYNSPISKKIYYKGDGKVVIIEPELEQVVYAKLDKIPNVLKLLKSAKKTDDGRLKTKFNGINYYITANQNKIDKITYTDEMQNRVIIQFSDEKVNTYINESRFAYSVPAGYDILEQN
jgi:outer membrane lipoprotein carrier protein